MLVGRLDALRYSADASAVRRVDAASIERPDIASFHLFDRWQDASYDGGERVIPYVRLVLGERNRPVALLWITARREPVSQALPVLRGHPAAAPS